MKEPLISVIVPVYNVAEYLERCLKSIVEQTYFNLEIILIDDGSTDNSSAICDDWSKLDARIKVIHKINGGLSDARNCGIDNCSGEYVAFIDSDDYVSRFYVENLYTAINNFDCDLSISGYSVFFDDEQFKGIESSKIVLEQVKILDFADCLKQILYADKIDVNAWGKLYKKSYFNEVRFPYGKLYEDIPVCYAVMKQCLKIAVLPNKDYFYYQRANSIQNAKFTLRKLDAVEHMQNLISSVEKDCPSVLKAAKCRYFSVVCNIMFQIKDKTHDKIRKNLWKEVKKYRRGVLFDNHARKKARYAAFLSYFGYNMIKFIYCKTQYRGCVK